MEPLTTVRRIEIKTRRLSHNIFSGGYHSAFKGRGMAFSEVRKYQIGDDVRDIDWNVTARSGKPHVKVFEEERELTVMLLIDVSGSLSFGTRVQTKRQQQTEIAATLAFSAIENGDKVGALFFTDKVEKFIPPKKGKKHILSLIHDMLNFKPVNRKTDIIGALEYLSRIVRHRSTAFIISDFYANPTDMIAKAGSESSGSAGVSNLQHALTIANHRHDLIAVQVFDETDRTLPDVGLINVEDLETGRQMLVDTSSKRFRKAHTEYWNNRQTHILQALNRSNVDNVSISTEEDYVKKLIMLFEMRM